MTTGTHRICFDAYRRICRPPQPTGSPAFGRSATRRGSGFSAHFWAKSSRWASCRRSCRRANPAFRDTFLRCATRGWWSRASKGRPPTTACSRAIRSSRGRWGPSCAGARSSSGSRRTSSGSWLAPSRQGRGIFDEQAESWDSLRAQLLDQAAGLFALVPLIRRGLRVADIGTGTGGMLPFFAEFAGDIVAVDISKEMLRRARARAKTLGLDNIEFVKADLHQLPIENASVDAAFATLVLHHAQNPAAALKEMVRILRPGGTLVVVDLVAHRHEWLREEQGDVWLGFTRDELVAELGKAGLIGEQFKIVSQVDTGKKGGNNPLKLFVASGTVPPNNQRDN